VARPKNTEGLAGTSAHPVFLWRISGVSDPFSELRKTSVSDEEAVLSLESEAHSKEKAK
jgi:hypothetical protein